MIRQIRKAVHAGTWYPEDRKEIAQFIDTKAEKHRAIAGVCPHAGWPYSGKTAGEVYSRMAPGSLYILLGPNHRGAGAPVSVYPEGEWETPLGNLPVDSATAETIARNCAGARLDAAAHAEEHSLEVQLPFIKFTSPHASIVPIALADYRPSVMKDLGEAVAQAVEDKGRALHAVLIASTDMSHYVPADYARKVDRLAIDRILALDPEGLLRTVEENDISMCGSGPTAAVLWAAKKLGAKEARLVRYTTSGETTGDTDQVVGYAGITIE